jgi:hypothetical protein
MPVTVLTCDLHPDDHDDRYDLNHHDERGLWWQRCTLLAHPH